MTFVSTGLALLLPVPLEDSGANSGSLFLLPIILVVLVIMVVVIVLLRHRGKRGR